MTDAQTDMLLERYHRANNYVAELEAENERLRAALEKIASDAVICKLCLRILPRKDEVTFRIEDGVEFAICLASDFRAAMNERDALRAENKQLREQLDWIRARVWDEQDSDEGIVYRLRIATRSIP